MSKALTICCFFFSVFIGNSGEAYRPCIQPVYRERRVLCQFGYFPGACFVAKSTKRRKRGDTQKADGTTENQRGEIRPRATLENLVNILHYLISNPEKRR